MDDDALDYARGVEVIEAGIPPRLLRRAAELMAPGNVPGLLSDEVLKGDGFEFPVELGIWIAPKREHPFTPIRTGLAPTEDQRRRTRDGPPATDEEVAAAARLPPAEVAARLGEIEAWDRWCDDPAAWRARWDLRALLIGEALRRTGTLLVDWGP